MLGGVCALQANAVCLGSLGHYNELAGHNREPILPHTNRHTTIYTSRYIGEEQKAAFTMGTTESKAMWDKTRKYI